METLEKKKKKRKGKGVSFETLDLSNEIFSGIKLSGFRLPTPIQRKALPVCLSGMDSIIMSRTGSGKTLAFVIPMLERILKIPTSGTGGVVISPTRELALQTYKVTKKLSCETSIKSITLLGGESLEKQFSLLADERPGVIIATPGRLGHLLEEIPDFTLSEVEILILDEADRLFDMGFATQIMSIMKHLRNDCQKILVSATMPGKVIDFVKMGLEDPVFVRLDSMVCVPEELRIGFFQMRSGDRDALLLHLLSSKLDSIENKKTLIFAATRYHVEYIALLLRSSLHIHIEMIYGTLDQQARKESLSNFRKGSSPIMVVTDVAARGMDIPELDYVIHYHFPSDSKLFIHRSGRVARTPGRIGYSFALLSRDDFIIVDVSAVLNRDILQEKEQQEKYTLQQMTPDHVHLGTVPEEALTVHVQNLASLLQQEDFLLLSKTCENAYKKYRKSRTKPSKKSFESAKNHPIFIHPLLVEDCTDTPKREEFLKEIKSYKPKETVFEVSNSTPSDGFLKVMHQRRNQLKKAQTEVSAPSIIPKEDDPKKMSHKKDYRDANYFISTDYTPQQQLQRQQHDILEKSSQNSVLQLQQSMLDIVGDENTDLVQKHRIHRWDARKKKYIQTTVGQQLSMMNVSKSKRIKLENGQFIKSKDSKVGQLYTKWQKKNQKTIGRVGVLDEVEDFKPSKPLSQIKKERKIKAKEKMKNMNKEDRTKIFRKRKLKQDEVKQISGYQGKKGFSGRYKKNK